MNINEIIETNRLSLRRFTLEDLDDFFEYAQMDEIGPNCGWEPIKDKNKALERLNKMINADYYYFAIVLKENNKVIGNISLSTPDVRRYVNIEIEDGAKEIGFALSKNYWGNGYMTEAVNEIIKYSFEVLNIPSIYSLTLSSNTNSIKLQEKCGLSSLKERIDVHWIDGSIKEMTPKKITKEEYFDKKQINI